MWTLRKPIRRRVALFVLLCMFVPSALAASKEIKIFGVRSINDEGGSDMRVTMDDLKADYQDFVDTDAVTEYFHKDQSEPVKNDLGEAYSWLIDNNVINRDVAVNVSNYDTSQYPSVTITKDTAYSLYSEVRLSDLIMYLYKAVFGPLWSRPIGFETEAYRVDGGKIKPFSQILKEHNASTDVSNEVSIVDSSTDGNSTSSVFVGNDVSNWRYTPQGDDYSSIYGDYNIFISQNEIVMNADDTVINSNNGGDVVQGSSGANAGDGGASINSATNNLDYVLDYKSVYCTSGRDVWFYNTNDVVETYIRAALNKGILEDDVDNRTDLFKSTFIDGVDNSTPYDSWSADVVPLIVNKSEVEAHRVSNVKETEIKDTLGVNYEIVSSDRGMTISRKNMFYSNSGYFYDENLRKIDIYKYIYRFVRANEKKISETEADLVSFKYDMELSGWPYPDDVAIVKDLLARGIINPDDGEEVSNLYCRVLWIDMIQMLYRIAKPDARYDFSKIQLTDSETQWRAKGFMPQTLKVVEKDEFGKWIADRMLTDDMLTDVGTAYRFEDMEEYSADTENLIQVVATSETHDGYTVPLINALDTKLSKTLELSGKTALIGPDNFSTDYAGLAIANCVIQAEDDYKVIKSFMDDAVKYFDGLSSESKADWIERATGTSTEVLNSSSDVSVKGSTYEPVTLPLHIMCNYLTRNIFCVGALQSKVTAEGGAIKVLRDYADTLASKGGYSDASSVTKLCDAFKNSMDKIQNSSGNDYYKAAFYNTQNKRSGGSGNPFAECSSNDRINFFFKTIIKGQVYWGNAVHPIVIQFGEDGSNATKFKMYLDKSYSKGKTKSDVVSDMNKLNGLTGRGGSANKVLFAAPDFSTQEEEENYLSANIRTVDTLNNSGTDVKQYIDENGSLRVGEETLASGAEGSSDGTAEVSSSGSSSGSGGSSDGSSGDSGDGGSGGEISTYTDPTGQSAFISWKSIQDYNLSCTDDNKKIPITQVSELLLYNTDTDTYGYFSVEDGSQIALVGTAVVTGDPDLGVAFKAGSAEGSEFYYHINAIRLLLDAAQETCVLNGIDGFELPDETFAGVIGTVPLINESGYKEYGVTGLRAAVEGDSEDEIEDEVDDSDSFLEYSSSDDMSGERVGRYLTMSQANRVMNVISRRINYTKDGDTGRAYAVVRFLPVDVADLGGQPCSPQMTMQDILDSAVTAPTGKVGKAAWNKNKRECNAYANWIYGTTGKDYIGTGYLKPEAYLYVMPDCDKDLPASAFEPLSKTQRKNIHIYSLNKLNGRVMPLTSGMDDVSMNAGGSCTYCVSSDYMVIVSGDRLYMIDGAFVGLKWSDGGSGDTVGYRLQSQALGASILTLGQKIKLKNMETDDSSYNTYVTEISKDGYITCQVGPIRGMPVHIKNDLNSVLKSDAKNLENKDQILLSKIANIGDTKKNNGEYPKYDALRELKDTYLKGIEGLVVKRVTREPNLTFPDVQAVFVNDGTTDNYGVFSNAIIKSYKSIDGVPTLKYSVKTPMLNNLASRTLGSYEKEITTKFEKASTSNGEANSMDPYGIYEFVDVQFPGYMYTLGDDNVITKSGLDSTCFISPSLLTCMNDLIVDEMILASNGSIPVNEVPAGSMLKCGQGYYMAVGSSKDKKEFVGYSYLQNDYNSSRGWDGDMNSKEEYLTDLKTSSAYSFASQYIRGGNQYVSVSHFMNKITLLVEDSELAVAGRTNALSQVASKTMSSDVAKYRATMTRNDNGQGSYELIGDMSVESSETANYYVGLAIKFSELLRAYKVSSPDASEERYELVNFAKSPVSGAYDKLPFWNDHVLDAEMYEQTTDVLDARFQPLKVAAEIKDAFMVNFESAFRGDLFTLARMIVVLLCCWFMITSWICFVCKKGGLAPVLHEIRNPSGGPGEGGFDLLRILSLGTISLDTELSLGKCIQYNMVIAVILVIVWKLGEI